MTSECYVYITLPGETKMVTAGKLQLETDERAGIQLGTFTYSKSYLTRTNSIEFDPKELKLSKNVLTATRSNGNFGALRDSSPDAWGRRLIDRYLGTSSAFELDYLLKSPDDRAGALGFGVDLEPPTQDWKFNQIVDLENLINLANEIVSDDKNPNAKTRGCDNLEQTERLLKAGTSMGGMRPKVTLDHNNCLWLAKFPLDGDRWNNPKIEHAIMTLGRECGLNVAETDTIQIGDRDVLLVRRFDRELTNNGYLRKRMISALTLLGADESHDDRWSYLSLAEEMMRFTESGIDEQLLELFRRMCFNCLVSNTDDHPRNHAFIADTKGWQLSPAYDITATPSHAVSRRDLAMAIGDAGRYANRENLISQAKRFRLSTEEATGIIDKMAEQVTNNWYSTARGVGVSELDCERISSAFNYEGFLYSINRNNERSLPWMSDI